MKRPISLRQLSAISDAEKQQLFLYIFEKGKERADIIRLARDNYSQSEKDIIIALFPEIKKWLFRRDHDENIGSVFKGSSDIGVAHYLRACHWLRSRGFEIPMGVTY